MITQILDSFCLNALALLSLQTLYAAIVFIAVMLVSLLLRYRYPYLMLSLWSLVLLRLVLPPDYSSAFSMRWLFDTGLYSEAALLHAARALHATTPALLSAPVVAGVPLVSWNVLCVLCWLAGCAYFLGRYYRQRSRFNTLLRDSQAVEDGPLHASLLKWQGIFTIRRPVRLVTGRELISPFTLGIFRPIVYIPAKLVASLSRKELEYVIAHELAHVKRLDDAWITVQQFLQRLFFFNPILLWCNRQIDNQREILRDQMVVAIGELDDSGFGKNYGKAMLHVLQILQRCPPPKIAAGYIGQNGFVRQRFLHLLKTDRVTPIQKGGVISLILALTIFLLPMAPSKAVQDQTHRIASSISADTELSTNFISPLRQDGKIINPFGHRKVQFSISTDAEFHRGIDIQAPVNSAIQAAADGVIEIAREGPRDATSVISGGYVVIRHAGGERTLYAHINRLSVREGQRVRTGALLGLLCKTFSPDGKIQTYLHFEVIKDGLHLDPTLALKW